MNWPKNTHRCTSCRSSRQQSVQWKPLQHRGKPAAASLHSLHLRGKMWFYNDAFHRKLLLFHLSYYMSLAYEVCDRALHCMRKTRPSKALNRSPLTYPSYQFNLKTVDPLLTAVTPQVGLFKLVNADGVVPLWAMVWKSFQPAISGVQELDAPFRYELDHLANVDPWHQVLASCWKAAW